MPRVLVVLALVALAMVVYGLIDAAQSSGPRVRHMPTWLWMVVIICLPGAGTLLWFALGRPRPPLGDPRRPAGPDDDPEFLRRL